MKTTYTILSMLIIAAVFYGIMGNIHMTVGAISWFLIISTIVGIIKLVKKIRSSNRVGLAETQIESNTE